MNLPTPPPRGVAVGVWGLVLFLACRLLDIFLEAQATASAVGQAVLVEWATSRLGVVWTDPKREKNELGRRAATGTGIGVGMAVAIFAVLVLSHGATMEGVANVSIPVLVIGLLTAALHAWRDELLHHGVVLRALGLFDEGDVSGRPHDVLRVVACGITSAGVALGRGDASARSVVVAALVGIAMGALWVRDRGAWMPWAAQTAFRFAVDTLLAGGILHLRLSADRWSGGDAGIFAGTAAVVALAPVAMAAIFAVMRRISPDPVRVG